MGSGPFSITITTLIFVSVFVKKVIKLVAPQMQNCFTLNPPAGGGKLKVKCGRLILGWGGV